MRFDRQKLCQGCLSVNKVFLSSTNSIRKFIGSTIFLSDACSSDTTKVHRILVSVNHTVTTDNYGISSQMASIGVQLRILLIIRLSSSLFLASTSY
jgi:hypothetical protein